MDPAKSRWHFRLYTAGPSPSSLCALANLKRFCEQHLDGTADIEVIDLLEQPQVAATDRILAVPTVIRKSPPPERKIVGDLSDSHRLLAALELSRDGNQS